jgi:hypothetical protein
MDCRIKSGNDEWKLHLPRKPTRPPTSPFWRDPRTFLGDASAKAALHRRWLFTTCHRSEIKLPPETSSVVTDGTETLPTSEIRFPAVSDKLPGESHVIPTRNTGLSKLAKSRSQATRIRLYSGAALRCACHPSCQRNIRADSRWQWNQQRNLVRRPLTAFANCAAPFDNCMNKCVNRAAPAA